MNEKIRKFLDKADHALAVADELLAGDPQNQNHPVGKKICAIISLRIRTPKPEVAMKSDSLAKRAWQTPWGALFADDTGAFLNSPLDQYAG